MPPALMSPPGIHLTTFLYSWLAGVVPFLNVEIYLLSVSALSPKTSTLPMVLAASSGQMAAKAVLYLAGRGVLSLPFRRRRRQIQETAARFAAASGRATALVLASSLTGIPPFFGVSLAAGFLRFPLRSFLVAGSIGRVLRFAAVFLLPRLFTSQ